jgi:hypothetical protein
MLLALLVAAAAATPAASTPPIAPLTFDPLSKGTVGIDFILPGGGAPDVGVTYFLADNMSARLDFGLDAVLSPTGTPATFNIGVGLRFYQWRRGPVAVFLSPAIAFGREKITAIDGAEYITFAGGAGVEYFFTDHLSAGGTLALGLKFGNLGAPAGVPGRTELSTANSGLFANIYF